LYRAYEENENTVKYRKINNCSAYSDISVADGLIWSGTGCFIAVGYLYGKSGR